MEMSLGSGLALACCSIVAPPAASPCALSICISVEFEVKCSSEACQKIIKTGVTWTLACSLLFEIVFRVVVVSSGVARITFHVYVD